ncbi:MAG TPA: tRNA (adenosine(37)-N6)-threonylcarbamoyltransferase complex dimerization subunit type 1 TsaB [Candidatus Limnocylindrales bacterium]
MTAPRHDGRNRAILALDTATSRVVIAVGSIDGAPLGVSYRLAEHRHGDHLLPAIGRVMGEANVRRSRVEAIVVGTGPGAFTGLRVGIATAKGVAHGLGRPLIGVATSEALIEAAAAATGAAPATILLLLPAGPSDRTVCRLGEPPRLLRAGTEPDVTPDDVLVAVDLDGRAPADATARGAAALDGIGEQLLRLGAERFAAGGEDMLATLVPEYVTLPRGITASSGEVAWSSDRR